MSNGRGVIAGALRLSNESEGDQPGENDRQGRRYRPRTEMPHRSRGKHAGWPRQRGVARDTTPEPVLQHVLPGDDAEQHDQARSNKHEIEPRGHNSQKYPKCGEYATGI
jgi:hypothetical protein